MGTQKNAVRSAPVSAPADGRKGPDNSLLMFLGNIGVIVLVIMNIIALASHVYSACVNSVLRRRSGYTENESILLGIGIIVVGKQIDAGIEKHDNITKLLDKVDFGSFTLLQIVEIIIVAIYVIGAVAIVISLTGGLGALLKLRVLLVLYIVILVLVVLLELALLGIWIDLLKKVHTSLQGLFDGLLKGYTGSKDITLYTIGCSTAVASDQLRRLTSAAVCVLVQLLARK